MRRLRLAMVAVCLAGIGACTSPQTAAPPVPQPRPLAPPPAEFRPEQLIGLTRDEAQALLGPPSAETSRAMASVWTYRRGGCVVSLMFYPEVGTAVERVLSTEVAAGQSAALCLGRLREERLRHGR